VERSRAPVFLDKAREFLPSAKRSLEAGDRDAAAVLAIHAGISACDSITVMSMGVRSNTRRHLDVLRLFKGLTFEGREQTERQLRELVEEKREVEYEDRRLLVGDAQKMVTMAGRIVKTAERVVERR
jgi:HEPN domain-containing protein